MILFLPFLLFLLQLWVGIMIQTQPFFIAGLDDIDEAKTNAFGATGMFMATFILSMVGIYYDSQYKPEPVGDASEPEAEYHLTQGDVPTYGTSG